MTRIGRISTGLIRVIRGLFLFWCRAIVRRTLASERSGLEDDLHLVKLEGVGFLIALCRHAPVAIQNLLDESRYLALRQKPRPFDHRDAAESRERLASLEIPGLVLNAEAHDLEIAPLRQGPVLPRREMHVGPAKALEIPAPARGLAGLFDHVLDGLALAL